MFTKLLILYSFYIIRHIKIETNNDRYTIGKVLGYISLYLSSFNYIVYKNLKPKYIASKINK